MFILRLCEKKFDKKFLVVTKDCDIMSKKNILNDKEYSKNKILRIKRQEKIDMQEIEFILDSLGVENMIQFYQQYGVIPNKTSALVFKINFYDFFAYRYLNMFFMYPYKCIDEYTRSDKAREIEFYEVLKQLYTDNDYKTFNYLSKILEFMTSDIIIEEFTPYLIANRLSK